MEIAISTMIGKQKKKSSLKVHDLTAQLNAYSRFMDLLSKMNNPDAEIEQIQDEIRNQIMIDLEQMYNNAKELGNMGAALKAKELQGKDLGMFGLSKKQTLKGIPVKPLSKMSLEELHYILSTSCEEVGIDMEALLEDSKFYLKKSFRE